MFEPGQRVECVADDWIFVDFGLRFDGAAPRRGGVYVVAEVYDYPVPFLGLVAFFGFAFAASAFRPIEDRQVDRLKEIVSLIPELVDDRAAP